MGNVKKARGAPPEPDLPPAPTPGKQTDMERLRLRPDPATKITGDGPMFEGEPAFGTGFVTTDDIIKALRRDPGYWPDHFSEVVMLPYIYQFTWRKDAIPEDVGRAAQRAARWAWEAVEKTILEEYGRRAKHLSRTLMLDWRGLPANPVQVYAGVEKGHPLLLLHPDDFTEYIRKWGL